MSGNTFTKNFLEKFPEIEAKTIESIVSNGYSSEASLLYLDVDKDLPQIPGISMGQKSFLRKILTEYQTSQQTLRQNFEKRLSHELVGITDTNSVPNGGQNTAESVAISSPESVSHPPTLTPFGGQRYLTVPPNGHELVPIASTSRTQLDYPFIPSTSNDLFLNIPQQSDEIMCLPSSSHSTPYSVSPISSSSTYTTRHSSKRRRFVRLRKVTNTEPRLRRRNQVMTCDKSTDSRYVLKTVIKTEDNPIVTITDDTELISRDVKQEFIEEDINVKSLKTTTIEKSTDLTSDDNHNTNKEVEEKVPKAVPLDVNISKNGAEDTESDDSLRTDPKTNKLRRRKKICYSSDTKKSKKSFDRKNYSQTIDKEPEEVPKAVSFEVDIPKDVAEDDTESYEDLTTESKTPAKNKRIKRRRRKKLIYSMDNKKSKNSPTKRRSPRMNDELKPVLCMIDGCDREFTDYIQLVRHRFSHREDPMTTISGSSLESKGSTDYSKDKKVADRALSAKLSDMERTASQTISTLKNYGIGKEVAKQLPEKTAVVLPRISGQTSDESLNTDLKEVKIFICHLNRCLKEFDTNQELIAHLKAKHFKKCPFCNKKYADLANHHCIKEPHLRDRQTITRKQSL